MSKLVLMRLERANYIRGGGSNGDAIMTEKDKSGGAQFISFAQQTHVLALIFQTCACWDHLVPQQLKTRAR
jgi:hypothetical protein